MYNHVKLINETIRLIFLFLRVVFMIPLFLSISFKKYDYFLMLWFIRSTIVSIHKSGPLHHNFILASLMVHRHLTIVLVMGCQYQRGTLMCISKNEAFVFFGQKYVGMHGSWRNHSPKPMSSTSMRKPMWITSAP